MGPHDLRTTKCQAQRQAAQVYQPWIAALVLVALILCTPAASADAAWSFANSQISEAANSYALGSLGGQCRVWAGDVVNAALSANGTGTRIGGYGSAGGAYYGAY